MLQYWFQPNLSGLTVQTGEGLQLGVKGWAVRVACLLQVLCVQGVHDILENICLSSSQHEFSQAFPGFMMFCLHICGVLLLGLNMSKGSGIWECKL